MISSSTHLNSQLHSYTNTDNSPKKARSFDYYTIPKSGTNMIKKFFSLIGVPENKINPQKHMQHMNIEQIDPDTDYIILVRDVRDVIRSLADWEINPTNVKIAIDNGKFTPKRQEIYETLKDMNLEERISFTVEVFMRNPSAYGVRNTFNLKLKNLPNVHFFKFEDIVGPQFGGSPTNIQRQTLKKIAALAKKPRKIGNHLLNALQGETPTFTERKKKVGSWESKMNPDQIEKIKFLFNDYLLEFGYETDPNWDTQFWQQKAS